MRLLRIIVRNYPFTASGSLLLGITIYLIGYARGTGNLYAFWFAATSFLLLTLLALGGRFMGLRLRFAIVSWQSRTLTARSEAEHAVSVSSTPFLPIFRLHYRVTGVFACGSRVRMKVKTEGSAGSDGIIRLPYYFPLCGTLSASGQLYICDVFGFVRYPLQSPSRKEVLVKPPLFPVPEALRVDITTNPEPSKRHQTADEEKYYMREYIPGDRLKDVNWKASMRLQELITRISPLSPEPSKLLHIEIRPYSFAGESIHSLMHLNYIKSWALSFIAAIHAKHPEYRFKIGAGKNSYSVADNADLENFASSLCDLHFTAESAIAERQPDELFIFTTAFDRNLASRLAGRGFLRTHLFRTSALPAELPVLSELKRRGTERLIRILHAAPGLALPTLNSWPAFLAFPRKITSIAAPVGGFSMEEKLKLALF